MVEMWSVEGNGVAWINVCRKGPGRHMYMKIWPTVLSEYDKMGWSATSPAVR